MSTEQGASILKFENRESKAYEWSFQIPARSTIIDNLSVAPVNQYAFSGLKFTTGVLGKIQHYWKFQISKDSLIYIHLWIKNSIDYGFIVHPCELQTFSLGRMKEKASFNLNKIDACNPIEYNNWSTQHLHFPKDVWDDSVDTLKIILNIQCEPVGKCINLPSVEDDLEMLSVNSELNTRRYFMSESLSDVTLVAGDEEFPAHRLVLSCRSPVFECMFQQDMKETAEGRVVIEDMDPEVLKEMLYFIYTGGLSNSNFKDEMLCIELLKSAEKYGIKGLKVKCAKRIAETITFENAVEIYILGEMHNEQILMQRAVEIMKQDKSKALKDPNMVRDLAVRYPKLAYELVTS